MVLLGNILKQPEFINADVIRGLRLNGEPPCEESLTAALKWIGKRSVALTDELIAEATDELGEDLVGWALEAIGYVGNGNGSGYGYGSGLGDGYGYGSGLGYGLGYGSGLGDGSGLGYGSNLGYGSGCGSGSGNYYKEKVPQWSY